MAARHLALFSLAASLIVQTGTGPSRDHTRSVLVDGRSRTYLLHVPASVPSAKPAAVVLAFHGGGADAESMARFSGLNEKADRAGFVVIYPNGTGRLRRLLTFNAGNCCGYAMQQQVNDVAFTRALLDEVATVVGVDRGRVYATGMSNGAMLAYRLAAELSDRLAAIAPVGGPMAIEQIRPQRPLSVMHFHGTDDRFAPFEGGMGDRSLSRTKFLSVGTSIQAWVKANGCAGVQATRQEPDRAKDGMTVTRTTYSPCKEASEVVLLAVQGGGHTWPGRPPGLAILGKSTSDISANDLMWEFFERHARK